MMGLSRDLEQRQAVPANNLADPLAEVIAAEAENDANVTCLKSRCLT